MSMLSLLTATHFIAILENIKQQEVVNVFYRLAKTHRNFQLALFSDDRYTEHIKTKHRIK